MRNELRRVFRTPFLHRAAFRGAFALLLTLSFGHRIANAEPAEIQLVRAFPNLKIRRPVSIVIPDDGSRRRFLLQQTGQIIILPEADEGATAKLFLDIGSRLKNENDFEEGLLNITFHPRFKENRKFYLYYTRQDPKRSRIGEFLVSSEAPDRPDMESERVLLEIPQPFWNHNSGNMLFGPDGYLYICVGDGGKRDGPHNLAQNLFVRNGKILRIDVDTRSGARQYGIPQDNPFVKTKGVLPEIWAYGLRNPWGIYFEPGNGRLWCGDVGQDIYEEIDIIVKGGNYGWNYREGMHRFLIRKQEPPAGSKFVEPILEYTHAKGISVTGGLVYRGSKIPDLKGWYVYGDWGHGKIWALRYDAEAGKVAQNKLLYKRPDGTDKFKPNAFCEDLDGEIFVLSWDGTVSRIAAR